jgi:mono/diheme cytochrome c family protein
MSKALFKLILFTSFLPCLAWGQWQRNVEVTSPRENIYGLAPAEFKQAVMNGRKHALIYPVTATELLIPYGPMKTFFETKKTDPVRKLLYNLAKVVSPFKSMNELYSWLGVHEYPREFQPENPNPLPELSAKEKDLPMGATIMHTKDGEGLTFSCAACHNADLFGVKVLGLTNRFPHANELFAEGKKVAPYINSFLFQDLLKTSESERQMFLASKNAVKFVGPKPPVVLGLDTSLAQVAMSLARRGLDPYATRDPKIAKHPRKNKLEKMVADSKPAVWWNVKYKNRWLSDGSIVSGNPVHTNFLWNEIGRGTDLKKLEVWMKENDRTIRELTAAVFASKPPRYEKFFGIDSIDIEKAKRGQKHYMVSCSRCHGVYEKGWELANAAQLSPVDQIQNIKLTYHKLTPVRDVGTDPGRYLGMNEFAGDLNRLQISKSIQTVVEPQKGYVPPPLDGIWSRWPYFHNNSAPNLCAVLTQGSERPVRYYAGAAKDKARDFDQECVGYPTGDKTPAEWKRPEYLYDSTKEGLSNRGHDERIFMKEGRELLTEEEKAELIEFLKTL